MSALRTLFPTLNDTAAAASNTTRIQALLDAGGNIELIGTGIVYTNKLSIGKETRLRVDPGMTLRQASGGNTNLLVSKALARAFTTVTLSWTAGPAVSVAWTAHGRAVGDYVWMKGTVGTTDGAYFGVFRVKSVTDANNLVLALRRTPAAAGSGTIQAKAADTNIEVEGGIWDYNYSQNAVAATSSERHCVVMAGVAGLRLRNMRGTDTSKFCFTVGAVVNYRAEGLSWFNTNSDGLKVYGPAFEGTVTDCGGIPNDDNFSIQAQEPAAFESYNYSGWGDVLGLVVDNLWADALAGTTGAACAVYAPTNDFVMDNIILRRIHGRGLTGPAINVVGGAGAQTIRSLKVEDCERRDGTLFTADNVTIYRLDLSGLRSRGNDAAGKSAIAIGTVVIQKLVLEKGSFYNGIASSVYFQTFGTPDIRHMVVRDINADGASASYGRLVDLNSVGTFGLVEIEDCNVENTQILVALSGSNTSTPTFVIKGNRTGVRQVAAINAACRVILANNLFSNADQGVLRMNKASAAFELESDGGNKLTGTSVLFVKVQGSETLTVKGMDMEVDVSALARADKQYCYNTNAALGTLAAAGLVVCQGAASGSWHLLADPTKAY